MSATIRLLNWLADSPRRFVDFTVTDQGRVSVLINDGLVDIVHGARRAQDMIRITDAGRQALADAGGSSDGR